MKYAVSIFLFIIIPGILFSQTVITGKTINEKQLPVAGMNIVITNKDQQRILAFSISDNSGNYKIAFSSSQDSISIKLSGIGYASVEKIIENNSQVINYNLEQKISILPTVEVKARPITVQGDTVNYNVASFSTSSDRSIGEVIAKLPGFTVDANGTILFNGKAISNYYINGLDLLESRYGMANNNISHDLVDKVQLLDNHQPIKIFDSLKVSTTPALNILLKKKAANKLIGTAKIAAGITPLITEDEIVAMQFNNNFQFISAYKFNNTGQTLNNEINQQATIQERDEPKQDKEQENILSVIMLPNPLLNERRYRFNENHLLHMSALKVLKNTGQLKFNVGYLKDRVNISGSNSTTLFLPTDTISLSEIQNNKFNVNKIFTDFNYSLNQKNKYIKNALKLQADLTDEEGFLKNTSNIFQRISKPYYQLVNDYLLIKPFKKKLLSINSATVLNNSIQELRVQPGPFADIFNDSLPYEQLNQKSDVFKFSTNNSISFQNKLGKSRQQMAIGAEYAYKAFTSSLYKMDGQHVIFFNDSFRNKLQWQNVRGYTSSSSILNLAKKKLTIGLPLEINNVLIKDPVREYRFNKNYLFANPFFNISAPLSANGAAELSVSSKSILGNFIQTAPGYILNNFRIISNNDSVLPVQKINNLTLSLSHKNPLNALFYNLSVSYSGIKNNTTFAQTYDGLFLERKAILLPSRERSLIVSSRINKYFASSKTNLSFAANYQRNKSVQIQQNNFVNIYNNNVSLSGKMNSVLNDFMEFENDAGFKLFNASFENTAKKSVNFSAYRFQNNLKINLSVNKKMALYCKAEYYKLWNNGLNSDNYLFADLGTRYKNKNIDVEVSCDNIANTREFTIKTISNNVAQTTETLLRGRTLLVKAYFKF